MQKWTDVNSLLKKWIVVVTIITSLLFCLLLVLSESIVASFLGHVACHFYPLEGLNYYNTSEEKRYILCNTQNSFLVHWSWLILSWLIHYWNSWGLISNCCFPFSPLKRYGWRCGFAANPSRHHHVFSLQNDNFYSVVHCFIIIRPCVEWSLTGGWKL